MVLRWCAGMARWDGAEMALVWRAGLARWYGAGMALGWCWAGAGLALRCVYTEPVLPLCWFCVVCWRCLCRIYCPLWCICSLLVYWSVSTGASVALLHRLCAVPWLFSTLLLCTVPWFLSMLLLHCLFGGSLSVSVLA